MPRGIPKNKVNGMSKMAAMRRALAESTSQEAPWDSERKWKNRQSRTLCLHNPGLKRVPRSPILHRC